jgi:glycosyltransferase involved in cell wall biosynthesis
MKHRQINVLYVNSQGEIGGVERFLDSILTNHNESIVRPVLLSCKDGPWLTDLSRRGVKVYCIERARLRQPTRCFREIGRILQAENIDIVHSAYAWCHALVAPAARWHGCKQVWFHHGPVTPRRWQGFLTLFPADLLLVNSYYLLSRLQRTAFCAKQTGVVHYGLDTTDLDPNDDLRSSFRRRWEISDDTIAVGLIGFIDSWKGQDTFLESALLLKHSGLHLRMFVIGGPRSNTSQLGLTDFETKLHDFVRQYELEDMVSFTGHLNIKEGALDGMDLVVHASTQPEPFGMVILEAMAKGKPIIASSEGGPSEILIDKVDGWLIQPRSADLLASAIEQLSADQNAREVLGREARKSVLSRFNPAQAAKRLESYYCAL